MNSTPLVFSVAVPRPLESEYTYAVPWDQAEEIQVGSWVKVPFGKSTTIAYVLEAPKPFNEKEQGFSQSLLREVLEIGPKDSAIPKDVLELATWAQRYYHAPIGEVLACAAPAPTLEKVSSKRVQAKLFSKSWDPDRPIQYVKLTGEQSQALDALKNLQTRVALLDGVTGSGKTEVYIELARHVLAQGKGVLFLVPEIALTSALHHRVEQGLGEEVGLWHSALAKGERSRIWQTLIMGRIRVLVGARSAVFAPIKNLGLIIVDEEHDSSFKQEDRFRYQARDLAVVRATKGHAHVVLGSATPSLESLENARTGKYTYLSLPSRVGKGGTPQIDIVDLKTESLIEDLRSPIAQRTLDEIRATILRDEQVMIFLNRRGFASVLICEDCGFVHECANCSITQTIYKRRAQLKCHVCGAARAIPDQCKKCGSHMLKALGAGTESLEEELTQRIPELKIVRLDRDIITSASRLEETLAQFEEGKANALLGTQMLVKGHNFPRVTLVVVMLADSLFHYPDFRSAERAYQVLTQVSGRAGRDELPGRVLIQTYTPEHPVLELLNHPEKREEFLEQERETRRFLHYPPYGRLARIRVERRDSQAALQEALRISQTLKTFSELEVLGPSEAFLEKAKGVYRWDLLVKATSVSTIQQALGKIKWEARGGRFLIDVDPEGL